MFKCQRLDVNLILGYTLNTINPDGLFISKPVDRSMISLDSTLQQDILPYNVTAWFLSQKRRGAVLDIRNSSRSHISQNPKTVRKI